MNVNVKALVGKLNEICAAAIVDAGKLSQRLTQYDVEIEHLLIKLHEVADSDLQQIYRHYGINTARLASDLVTSVERFKRGNSGIPLLSRRIFDLITEAWTLASVEYDAPEVRTAHLFLTFIGSDRFADTARACSAELGRVQAEDLRLSLREITAGSAEDKAETVARSAGPGPAGAPAPGPTAGGKTPFLDQYTVDVTARARRGEIDPVLGRDLEIRQVIDILTRRRQNNPILTGEAGVGKTAVVEGLALRIAKGDVPPPLQKVSLRSLDLALLQAGAGVRGEFENRLKSVINEVKTSAQPVIVFIDEAHTMIGAGGQAGQGDAANLLKPALARGELRTVAATTWAEYKQYFEKDPALTRRFQVVKVDEPGETSAIHMMRGLVGTLEGHHGVRILDEAVDAAVRLSHRYISERQLPDKAVSVLDTACARVALAQVATPSAIEASQRRVETIDTEVEMLTRESRAGADLRERLDQLGREKGEVQARLATLQTQWESERRLVGEIAALLKRLEAHAASDGVQPDDRDLAALQADLKRLNDELAGVQGESPLMQACVNEQTVAEIVSGWTGIPVGKVVKNEIQTVLGLKDILEERIIGQPYALEAISQRIRTAKAKLEDPRRPIAVFMLVGPSGVGKTETALTLSDVLYGGERNVITINMSEYQESHTVSGLKGAPPGYIGYEKGGVLTEAVRRRPYSIVLLDEMEKAHSDVHELFYQVFDKGMLEDGTGRVVDFKNTIILMTSNAATDTIMKLCADPETRPEPEGLVDAIRPELVKIFKPAFLGRTTIVPYYPISDEIMRRIIALQLGRLRKRLDENSGTQFSYDPALVENIAGRCTETDSGARIVDHILTRSLLPDISRELLARMAEGQAVASVHVGVGDGGRFDYRFA